jgi:hypothetical protein
LVQPRTIVVGDRGGAGDFGNDYAAPLIQHPSELLVDFANVLEPIIPQQRPEEVRGKLTRFESRD